MHSTDHSSLVGLSPRLYPLRHVAEARDAYEKVQAAYDRAVTLTQTQKIAEIFPALKEAKMRLLAAEVEAGMTP